MKKILFMMALLLSMAVNIDAQLYAPCYSNYQGVGYFVMPNGYYYGQIYAGYPQGEGYCYCIDPQMGAVFYHGYFDRGLCNGYGELITNCGYICGTWSHGDFISQTNVQPQQMQQSYYNVWSNYWNSYATTPSYTPSYDWNWSTYPYPTYSYPNSTAPANNYQARNEVKIPANTTITQIDSDTQLGRQLLGKIGR